MIDLDSIPEGCTPKDAKVLRKANLEFAQQNFELAQQNFELAQQNFELKDEVALLKTAILETLEENGHLADGDNCTLIKLKPAIGE